MDYLFLLFHLPVNLNKKTNKQQKLPLDDKNGKGILMNGDRWLSFIGRANLI